MTISDAENRAWHQGADRAAQAARTRILDQLDGVSLDQNDRTFIARVARHGDPNGLAALLAKLRASLAPPTGVATQGRVCSHAADAVKWRSVEASIQRAADHGNPVDADELLELAGGNTDTQPACETGPPLPTGVTIDRYRVDNSEPTIWREVWVERHHHTGLFFIAKGTWSDAELWNFTLGDWHNPWRDDSYDAAHYERPEREAIDKARQIVGLD
ncbi:hypothetical protein [Nonomuraea sp. NPDC005650]|uniref:hypothetical protein n=1 Tax=Nonomuraea sp. NPDC005650 TaxID=3157045 RepID=UPI0033B1847D